MTAPGCRMESQFILRPPSPLAPAQPRARLEVAPFSSLGRRRKAAVISRQPHLPSPGPILTPAPLCPNTQPGTGAPPSSCRGRGLPPLSPKEPEPQSLGKEPQVLARDMRTQIWPLSHFLQPPASCPRPPQGRPAGGGAKAA